MPSLDSLLVAVQPLKPELIVPRNPKPRPGSIEESEEALAHELATLPEKEEMQEIVLAITAKVAKDILVGKLPFRNAGEASKVARDFAAIAKDMGWADAPNKEMKSDTAEDRKDSFAEIRKRAQEALKNSG